MLALLALVVMHFEVGLCSCMHAHAARASKKALCFYTVILLGLALCDCQQKTQ
jgi:hypothetical protein